MRLVKYFIVFIWAISIPAQTSVNSDEWNGIKLLNSTKNNVEKIIGTPIRRPSSGSYDTGQEIVTVWYSNGTCRENESSEWNVPKNTVIGITISPKESVNASKITNNLSQFQKNAVPHFPERFLYSNKDGSIKFETQILPNMVEEVIFVDYTPTENNNRLRCVKAKNQ